MPQDNTLQISTYLGIVDPAHVIQRNPISEEHFKQAIEKATSFEQLARTCRLAEKTAVFSEIAITGGQLNWPEANGDGLILDGKISFTDVTVTSAMSECTTPRMKFTSSTVLGDVTNNNFQRSNFSTTTFCASLQNNDFDQSNLVSTTFKAEIKDCNFTLATLTNAEFKAPINGLTCFAGANLKATKFHSTIGDKVILIGSNISEQDPRPEGGIQTVNELKDALSLGVFSSDEVSKLLDIMTLAHTRATNTIDILNGLPYHINTTHLDHINRAVVALKSHLTPQHSANPSS